MNRYTVVLLYPEDHRKNKGKKRHNFFLFYASALDPQLAEVKAQHHAHLANPTIMADDFEVLAVFPGCHDDVKEYNV